MIELSTIRKPVARSGAGEEPIEERAATTVPIPGPLVAEGFSLKGRVFNPFSGLDRLKAAIEEIDEGKRGLLAENREFIDLIAPYIELGNTQIVLWAVENIPFKGESLELFLSTAIEHQSKEVIELLLKLPYFSENPIRSFILTRAAIYGSLEVFQHVMDKGFEVSGPAIYCAADHGQEAIVELLVKNGVRFEFESNDEFETRVKPTFYMAAKAGNLMILKIMLEQLGKGLLPEKKRALIQMGFKKGCEGLRRDSVELLLKTRELSNEDLLEAPRLIPFSLGAKRMNPKEFQETNLRLLATIYSHFHSPIGVTNPFFTQMRENRYTQKDVEIVRHFRMRVYWFF